MGNSIEVAVGTFGRRGGEVVSMGRTSEGRGTTAGSDEDGREREAQAEEKKKKFRSRALLKYRLGKEREKKKS